MWIGGRLRSGLEIYHTQATLHNSSCCSRCKLGDPSANCSHPGVMARASGSKGWGPWGILCWSTLVRWLDLGQVLAGVPGDTWSWDHLGGLLEPVWAWGLGLIGVSLIGWLEHVDPSSVYAIKVESEHEQWHLLASPALDKVPAASLPLADTLGFVNGFLSLTI